MTEYDSIIFPLACFRLATSKITYKFFHFSLVLTLLGLICGMPVHAEKPRALIFPADPSYGTIMTLDSNWSISEKHPKGKFFSEAKGTIPITTGDALMLVARFPLTDNPAALNKLPVDAFQCINISSLPAEDKIFGPLTRLTGLRRIDLDEGEFSDKGFAQLRKLINLEGISVKECMITGESLSHFGTLKKLKFLSIKHAKLEWNLLSRQAADTLPGMDDLLLINTNLNDQGISWLEKMPNLTRLTLDGDLKLTDKGLAKLKNLKKLQRLSIKEMKAITANGLMQLKGSSIKQIWLEDSSLSASDIKRVVAAMPGVRLAFRNRPVKTDMIDMFAPLH
jgi:hypothetical protein